MRLATLLLAGLAVIAGPVVPAAQPASSPECDQARQLLDTAGLKGGLVVHLGCGDGKLTAALRASDAFGGTSRPRPRVFRSSTF